MPNGGIPNCPIELVENFFGSTQMLLRASQLPNDFVFEVLALTQDALLFQSNKRAPGAMSRMTKSFVGFKRLRRCGHHAAHAMLGLVYSPFDEPLVLSFDGGGSDGTFVMFRGSRDKLAASSSGADSRDPKQPGLLRKSEEVHDEERLPRFSLKPSPLMNLGLMWGHMAGIVDRVSQVNATFANQHFLAQLGTPRQATYWLWQHISYGNILVMATY